MKTSYPFSMRGRFWYLRIERRSSVEAKRRGSPATDTGSHSNNRVATGIPCWLDDAEARPGEMDVGAARDLQVRQLKVAHSLSNVFLLRSQAQSNVSMKRRI